MASDPVCDNCGTNAIARNDGDITVYRCPHCHSYWEGTAEE